MLTTTHQKALIVGPLLTCRVGFYSNASDPLVGVGGNLEKKQ